MSEQRPPIFQQRTPPPKPKRTFAETEESLMTYSQIHNTQLGRETQSEELLVNRIYEQIPERRQPQDQTAPRYVSLTSPISRLYPNSEAPPVPPRRNVGGFRSPSESVPQSPVTESTPKKGIIRNVYARARGLFTGRKDSPYKNPQQKASASTSTASKEQGVLRTLWRTTFSILNNTQFPSSDRSSDQDTSGLGDSSMSSPDRSQGPKSPDYSSDVSGSYFTEGSSNISGHRSRRSTDTSSDDSDKEDGYARIGKIVRSEVLSIRVNAPANIRVSTSDDGEVTTCIKTLEEND